MACGGTYRVIGYRTSFAGCQESSINPPAICMGGTVEKSMRRTVVFFNDLIRFRGDECALSF